MRRALQQRMCPAPAAAAAAPQVGLTRKQIARLIGRVFIQKSAVNLLSTVGGWGWRARAGQ